MSMRKPQNSLHLETRPTSALIGGPNLLTSAPFRHHPANEVYVTGTFDDWARSVKLEKKGDHFEKLVELPLSNEKIFYKVCCFTAPAYLYEEVRPIHGSK